MRAGESRRQSPRAHESLRPNRKRDREFELSSTLGNSRSRLAPALQLFPSGSKVIDVF